MANSIPLSTMQEGLDALVMRQRPAGRALAFAALFLLLSDLAFSLATGWSCTLLLVTWAHRHLPWSDEPMDLGYFAVFLIQAAWILWALALFAKAGPPPTMRPRVASILTLGARPPRQFLRFLWTRLPLALFCSFIILGLVGVRTVGLVGSQLGGLVLAMSIVGGWMIAGLVASAYGDHQALVGIAAAAILQGIAIIYAYPNGAAPPQLAGFEVLLFSVTLLLAFITIVETFLTRRVAVVSNRSPDGRVSHRYVPFSHHQPSPCYVRFDPGDTHLVVMRRKQNHPDYAVEDVRDDHHQVSVHDHSVLVWDVSALANALKAPVERTVRSGMFTLKTRLAAFPMTEALTGGSAVCQSRVVNATDDFLFKSGNLQGLVGDAVAAALEEYAGGLTEEMERIRRESRRLTLHDGRAAERATTTTGAADYENKSTAHDKLIERALDNLSNLENLEIRVTAVKKDLDGFAVKGGPLLVNALVGMLEQRLAAQPGGTVDEAEAKRVIAALGLRLDAPVLSFGQMAAEIESTVTKAIEKLHTEIERSQSRMEKAEDDRADLYRDAARAAINASPIQAGRIFADARRGDNNRQPTPPLRIDGDEAEEQPT